jgi:methionyl-tRNA synthetase
MGDDVWFLIGMDEHGQKVAQTAAAAGAAPAKFVDGIAEHFRAMWTRLAISHDQFMRTSAREHHAAVTNLLEQIFKESPDDFYERTYTGMYCVGCESFKQPADVTDGRCALHPTRTLEEVTERNWFFRLSAYTERLRAHITRHPVSCTTAAPGPPRLRRCSRSGRTGNASTRFSRRNTTKRA